MSSYKKKEIKKEGVRDRKRRREWRCLLNVFHWHRYISYGYELEKIWMTLKSYWENRGGFREYQRANLITYFKSDEEQAIW